MPAYSFRDASFYLGIPLATLRSWTRGRYYPTKEGQKFFKPIFHLPDAEKPLLSFTNLVEAHVLNAIRRQYGVDLNKVRKSITYIQRHFSYRHPLADQRFETDGINLFIHHYGDLINVSQDGQLAMRAVLEEHLSRLEHDPTGRAARLYPFLRANGHRENKSVVIDPFISFGNPVIAGTGIPTAVIASRFVAGDSVVEIARDYGRETFEVEEAIRYERAA
ncbi:MAG: DUF433 domain-containing protein [Acidobacteriota bacterium]|nr:DUF433 domain-containing protein [Acidobacteriota bacterium]